MSTVSRNGLQRGWYRETTIKLKTPTGKAYYIHCTTWCDNKQILFLILNEVGYTEGLTVKINSDKKKKQETISGPRTQSNYVTYFNAIDKNNYDRCFYSTTIRNPLLP